MDSSIAADPRFRLLGRALGVSWREVIGSCYLVWLACYERRSDRFRAIEIDVAAEIDGFADALVNVGLAHAGDDETIVVHGVERRIKFLTDQSERGAKGGKKSGKSRRSKRSDAEADASAPAEANASGTAEAYTPSPDPSPPPDPDHKEPAPRGEPPDVAFKFADFLRDEILKAEPGHVLAKDSWPTSSTRRKWARDADKMNRLDGREWKEAAQLARWAWSPANLEAEASFRIESVGKLRGRYDALKAARGRSERPPAKAKDGSFLPGPPPERM